MKKTDRNSTADSGFQNKSFIVIGGARGIGATVCRLLGEAGARVAWTHLGNPADTAGSAELRRQLEAVGADWCDRAVDCTDDGGTRAFVDEVAARWHGLHGLVYAAGFTSPVGFMNLTAADWRRVVDINLNGAFIAAQAAIPHLRAAGGGALALIGSAAIVAGGGGRADYASAKAGLEGLNRAITKEFAPAGIRCNLVHPSLIDTDLLRQRHPDPEQRRKLAEKVPLRRLGRPEDVAQAVLFLLSDRASYITGQSLYVDGGRTFCG